MLPQAPRWVVLAGCETARTASSPLEGFGLANALVVAGSQGVVASVQPVADKNVGALLAKLYRNWQGQEDMATALQQAQLDWRRENSASEDWKSFRLVEP